MFTILACFSASVLALVASAGAVNVVVANAEPERRALPTGPTATGPVSSVRSCLIPNRRGHGVDVWPFVGTDCPWWTANMAIWCGTVDAVGTTHPQQSCLLFWMFLP